MERLAGLGVGTRGGAPDAGGRCRGFGVSGFTLVMWVAGRTGEPAIEAAPRAAMPVTV